MAARRQQRPSCDRKVGGVTYIVFSLYLVFPVFILPQVAVKCIVEKS